MNWPLLLWTGLAAVAGVLIVMVANVFTIWIFWGWIKKYVRRLECGGSPE
jgi:uncharacterized integral membrane protein